MSKQQATADVNIHLRARPQDRVLIDRAAELVGANRSQFMLASAIKEAKAVLLDQTSVYMDAPAFRKTLDWMDAPVSPEEAEGMKRLMAARTDWSRD